MYTTDMSIREIREGLKAGAFSARDVVTASFDHIDKADQDVHAYLELTQESAFAAAEKVDAALADGTFDELGPLAGVPVAFKDNMNLQGTHTTCSSKMLENYVSPYTATCVQSLIDAGALPLGKLNMDEFAFGSSTETSYFGPTKNPWDLERVPGGSSGGSAAAVAAGLACVTLGSDTGGSIRQPASFCGVVGVKPTYGLVSRFGVVAFASSLDQVGPFARTVEDAAYTMNVLIGQDKFDSTSHDFKHDFVADTKRDVKGMRIGVVPGFMEARGLTDEVKKRTYEAAEKLHEMGAEIVTVDLPHAQDAISAYYILGPCEAFSNLSRFDAVRYGYCDPGHHDLESQYNASREIGFGLEARRRMLLGSYLLSSGVYEKYYLPAQKVRTLITQDYQRAYEKCDLILLPSSPRTSFKFGEIGDPVEMHLSDIFTVSINIAGNGGMSVPCGLGEESHLPIGVQLVCPHFKDGDMFCAAAALERAYGVAPVAPDFSACTE